MQDTLARTVGPVRDRSLTEWVVLALTAEGTTHGFDVAREVAEGSSLGRIWTVRRPLVYRAVDSLVEEGLLAVAGTEEGRGPQRRLLTITPAGQDAVAAWLDEPVEHVRDVRTELLVKLELSRRRGLDLVPLLEAQEEVFEPLMESLGGLSGDAPVDLVTLWRQENARTVARFLAAARQVCDGRDSPP